MNAWQWLAVVLVTGGACFAVGFMLGDSVPATGPNARGADDLTRESRTPMLSQVDSPDLAAYEKANAPRGEADRPSTPPGSPTSPVVGGDPIEPWLDLLKQIPFNPPPKGEGVITGVVVDMALERGVATVVSLVDGSTSLYTVGGGGVVGGGSVEPIGLASEALVYAAERDVEQVPPVTSDDRSLPPTGYVRFWLLTYAGVRMAEARADDIDRDHPLWRLHLGAQEVITNLRLHGGT